MSDGLAMLYRIGDFELHPGARRLISPDGPVHIEPQVFDVLVYLVENRDRVVPKTELLDTVWGSRFVSESALTSRIKALRSALGDSGREQHTVRTSHGTGYQFIAEVTETAGDDATHDDASHSNESDVLRRLPVAPDPLWGRTSELAALAELIATTSLVTVLGPGGTGKTRLCLEVATRVPAERDAVFVDLSAVRDEDAVGEAVAAALAIDAGTAVDTVEACTAFLRSRPSPLIVIDNCEHVSQAAADLVGRIVSDAPRTAILATSRTPLGLRSESLFRLDPLPVPADVADLTVDAAATSAAISLFVERASRVDRDFALDDESVRWVAALCAALDGLPLAIELAAGRAGVFSLPDLVERLDRRLDLLGDDASDTSERHRTLRATLDWSYDLLDEQCRRLFRHLAVFPAGLLLSDLEWLGEQLQMSVDPVAAVAALADSSLLGRSETPSGTRYTQLETMRTFGVDRLRAADEVPEAHDLLAAWALQCVEEMAETLRSPREFEWNDRIRREFPNIREARVHLRREGRWSELVRISAALQEWGRLRDVSELWTWATELSAQAGLGPTDRARADAMAAEAAWRVGDHTDARILAERVLAARESGDHADEWATFRARSALGVAHLFAGDFEEAGRAWSQIDPAESAVDAINAAIAQLYAGDVEGARSQVARLRVSLEAEAWPTALAWSDYVTGEIEWVARSHEATAWLESAVERARAVGSSFTLGVAGVSLCTAAIERGDTGEAARRLRDLISHWLRSGTWAQLWTTLRHTAAFLADAEPELAIAILDAADADPHAPGTDDATRRSLEDLRASLSGRTVPADRTRPGPVDRSELAQRARTALQGLCDR